MAYVPWKASAASVLETLRKAKKPVAAVVNEFGETVGVVTIDDLLRRIFAPQTGRSEMLWRRTSIHRVGAGVWQVTGITGIRRLERFFGLTLPPTRHFTIAGVLQERLERVPRVGDECDWGPFRLRVVQVRRARLLGAGAGMPMDYADPNRVADELAESRRIFAARGWPVIDVTRRSIEETAAAIINLIQLGEE